MDLSGVKLMWCNYPNMPTGANGSRELFEKLVAFGRRHNIVICHDNPYSFILNDRPLSILSVPGAKEICIELNSMSKTFNMPGWRIGMVATNSRFLEWILRVKSNMDSGMFRPMQLAAVEALKAPDSWYQRMNEVYRRRRALAARILETLGCDVRDDQVGMFLWGRVNPRGATHGCRGVPERCRGSHLQSGTAPVAGLHHSGLHLRLGRAELHPHLALLQRGDVAGGTRPDHDDPNKTESVNRI